MIILGLFCYLFICLLITPLVVLIGDIFMMRYVTGISWKESVHCGILYFLDRFRIK